MAQVLGHGPIPSMLSHTRTHTDTYTHTLKSQTGDLPGQLVQILPAELETLTQREKLRHGLQEPLHNSQRPASTSFSTPHLSLAPAPVGALCPHPDTVPKVSAIPLYGGGGVSVRLPACRLSHLSVRTSRCGCQCPVLCEVHLSVCVAPPPPQAPLSVLCSHASPPVTPRNVGQDRRGQEKAAVMFAFALRESSVL